MALPATPAFSKKLRLKIIARRIIIVPKIYLLDSCGKANLENLFSFEFTFLFFFLFFITSKKSPDPRSRHLLYPKFAFANFGDPAKPGCRGPRSGRVVGGWRPPRGILIIILTQSDYFLNPVPAGINFPIITFSFSPLNLSSFPLMAALIRTREVS